jgi:hypothetical protein
VGSFQWAEWSGSHYQDIKEYKDFYKKIFTLKIMLKNVFRTLLFILVFGLLTVVTQIGGVALLFSWLWYKYGISKYVDLRKGRIFIKISVFMGCYLGMTAVVALWLAPMFGRVPLPMFLHKNVAPVNILTCILNRNYVRPALKTAVENVALQFENLENKPEIRYLDANFPFWNGFPLIPHLSHSDGRKLDVAFFYKNKNTGLRTNKKPAFSGYGVFEGPRKGERDRISECKNQGFWQYDKAKYMQLGANEADFLFDESHTKTMIQLFAKEKAIEKMFIEPHLQTRLHLENEPKIRLHGCKAVRHDDHLHVQIVR